MATIKINYPSLENAAKQALNVATEMGEYADAIPGKITNPLGNLTGGSSSNTSTVQSLASQKASDLRKRASRYQSLSSQITSFVESAREADAQVKNRLTSIADRQAEKLNLWQRISYEFYKLYNGIVGSTPLGAFFNNLLSIGGSYVEWMKKCGKDVLEWFQHGEGRYVLSMALSVIGTISAIAGAILSFPVSGVFATLVAAAAIVSALVSAADTVATLYEGTKAIMMNNTHPGVARHYGNTSSVSDWAKKESTDAGLQSLFAGINTVGNIAGIFSFVGGGFTKTLDNGTKIGTLDFNTVKGNFAKSFGFSFNETTGRYSFSPKITFGFGQERTEAFTFEKGSKFYSTKTLKIFHGAETAKIVTSPMKNIGSSAQIIITSTATGSLPSVKNIATLFSNAMPNLKGYSKIIGWVS